MLAAPRGAACRRGSHPQYRRLTLGPAVFVWYPSGISRQRLHKGKRNAWWKDRPPVLLLTHSRECSHRVQGRRLYAYTGNVPHMGPRRCRRALHTKL
jgi:hypothetical protein